LDCFLPGRVDDGCAERAAGLFDVTTHDAAAELDALIRQVLLESMVRHAERELLHQDVRDHRRVQQSATEQRLRCLDPKDGWPIFARQLVLGGALDEHREAAATKHELQAFLEADPLGGLLQILVQDFQQKTRQIAGRKVPTTLGPRLVDGWLCPALIIAAVGLGYGLIELLLELLFCIQEAAQRELQLARVRALGLVAVDAPLEQLVFVRQIEQCLAQRLILRFDGEQLCLERRNDGG
jgi:hypothetical protein